MTCSRMTMMSFKSSLSKPLGNNNLAISQISSVTFPFRTKHNVSATTRSEAAHLPTMVFYRRLLSIKKWSSCSSLKKIEVQVGSNLTVGQRSPTYPLQFTGCSLSWSRTCITVWIPTSRDTCSCNFQALHHFSVENTGSTGKCISIQMSLPWAILDLEVKSAQEFNPICKLSLGIFDLDDKTQRGMRQREGEGILSHCIQLEIVQAQPLATIHPFWLPAKPEKTRGLEILSPFHDVWCHNFFSWSTHGGRKMKLPTTK